MDDSPEHADRLLTHVVSMHEPPQDPDHGDFPHERSNALHICISDFSLHNFDILA